MRVLLVTDATRIVKFILDLVVLGLVGALLWCVYLCS